MRTLGILVVAAVLGATAWFAWMDWWDSDTQYEPWQAIGSGVCVVVLVAMATWHARGPAVLAVPVVVTLAYTVAWCVTMFPKDDTGMAGVGAILVLMGVGTATSAITGIVFAGRRWRRG